MGEGREPQKVKLGEQSDVVLAVDPIANEQKWVTSFLFSSPSKGIDRNRVVPLIVPFAEIFPAIGDQMRATSGADDFIYIAAWDIGLIGNKRPNMGSGQTLDQVLQDASARGVAIRALITHHNFLTNLPELSKEHGFINSLTTGKSIFDNRHLNAGSHHQKLVLIKQGTKIVAFCGGIDMEAGRNNWHDTHCMVEGPAAVDLLNVFTERWRDHPLATASDVIDQSAIPAQPTTGELMVDVRRTYGDCNKHAGLSQVYLLPALPSPPVFPPGPAFRVKVGSGTYSFAPSGTRELFNFLVNAIEQTESFIYLEDQYLVASTKMAGLGDSMAKRLEAKVKEPDFQRLVILISRTDVINSELFQGWQRRRDFIGPLLSAAPSKVIVCQHKIDNPAVPASFSNPAAYCHSKTWIFDDEVAFISSANCNRRGYTHDSEVGIGVFDPNLKGDRLYFAHQLRITKWKQLLRGTVPDQDLLDPIAASNFFMLPPVGASIIPYDVDGDTSSPPQSKNVLRDGRVKDFLSQLGPLVSVEDDWNVVVDPDGS